LHEQVFDDTMGAIEMPPRVTSTGGVDDTYLGGIDMSHSTPRRRPLSKTLRFAVLERDNFTCQYCGAQAPSVKLHVDHVVPVARGGRNDYDNLLVACESCNQGKSAKTVRGGLPARYVASNYFEEFVAGQLQQEWMQAIGKPFDHVYTEPDFIYLARRFHPYSILACIQDVASNLPLMDESHPAHAEKALGDLVNAYVRGRR